MTPKPYRRCLLEPIPEILEAANLLRRGAEFHKLNDYSKAKTLFKQANMGAIGNWTDRVWGKHDPVIHKVQHFEKAPPLLKKDDRVSVRMPNKDQQAEIISRDGYHCRFCQIPLVSKYIRTLLSKIYPEAVPWGRKNSEQHFALQAMWLQFDHLVPHSRGGGNELENIVITCAPCNFGRMDWTIEELGLFDPRMLELFKSDWDGLCFLK